MRAQQLAELILDGHIRGVASLDVVGGCQIQPMLDYSGIMAKTAFDSWKGDKNRGRRKVGCFDFKIYYADGSLLRPLLHPVMIRRAPELLSLDLIERVFAGEDPTALGCQEGALCLLRTIQLAMLEQEINWGDENFQTWSHFAPSVGRRPRDFVMAYLRRVYAEPSFLQSMVFIRAASGTESTLSPPLDKSVWGDYLEAPNPRPEPWLNRELLLEFRRFASSRPDNPLVRNQPWA